MPRESPVGACLTKDLPAKPTPAFERLSEDHRPFADLAAERMLRDAGYLKVDGSYIAPELTPVPAADN